MVDAADTNRLGEAKAELDGLMQMPELKDLPVVVFGNKVDKKEAMKELDKRRIDLDNQIEKQRVLAHKAMDKQKDSLNK